MQKLRSFVRLPFSTALIGSALVGSALVASGGDVLWTGGAGTRLWSDPANWQDGVLVVFCPHTTCGITINEGFDPDVARDMTHFFHEHIPQHGNFRHAEGNSDAHIKAGLFGASAHIIVEQGKLQLGTWQAVWLFEGDGPRKRQVWLKWLKT